MLAKCQQPSVQQSDKQPWEGPALKMVSSIEICVGLQSEGWILPGLNHKVLETAAFVLLSAMARERGLVGCLNGP